MKHYCFFYLWAIILSFITLNPSFVLAEESKPTVPVGFKLIGQYKTKSKVQVENGVSLALLISPLVYSVYSDGVDVRIYCEGVDEEHYASYQIYSSEGIGLAGEQGETDYVAGVQAHSLQGDMVRQISLTRYNLVMVKMPSRSHRVMITHAAAFE